MATTKRYDVKDLALASEGVRQIAAILIHTRQVVMSSDAFVSAHDQRPRQFSFGTLHIAEFEFRDSDPQTSHGSRAVDRHRLVQN